MMKLTVKFFFIALILGQQVLGQATVLQKHIRVCDHDSSVIPLPDQQGFLISISDSTLLDYPKGTILTMASEDLGREFSKDFKYHYHIDGVLYMVHSGGGVVYAYDGETLERIDDSFYHHNQYRGIPFSYDDQIYLYGGQGLFMKKNFITRYDFAMREWLEQETTGQRPEVTIDQAGIAVGDYFYVIVDRIQTGNREQFSKKRAVPLNYDIYRLDLTQWHWQLMGQVNPDLADRIQALEVNDHGFLNGNDLWVISSSGLFQLDFVHNNVTEYESRYPLNNAHALSISNIGDGFMGLYCDSKNEINLLALSAADLEELKVGSETLYQANLDLYYKTILKVIGLLFLTALVLILVNELRFEQRLVLRLKSRGVLFKSRNIKVFSDLEVEVLMALATGQEVSFGAVEDMVSDQNDSQSVRIKKRERLLRLLQEKIATLFNHEPDEREDYLQVYTHQTDKRSRMLRLHPEFFKVM